MINETFEKGSFPDSTKKSIITLIFKKGDKTLLKNNRPISLTNCDYKILAFALARCLQKVIPNLISDDQTGYVSFFFFFKCTNSFIPPFKNKVSGTWCRVNGVLKPLTRTFTKISITQDAQ